MPSEAIHPVDVHVGKRLRESRTACGVTQAELGADLGISAQQVQKYENGSNRISASKLFEIAGRLGTGIDWFFEGLEARAPVLLGETQGAFEAEPTSHEQTRAMIAAFRALPDDAARTDALTYVQNRAEQT
ncbi:helix-turn-helix domain-containing protein [Sphingosinicella xenopeptidilytica]|uniref:Helix-turn-helix domain-containing protein n=1 Tax=Sphingosinicella xenopeptidilytica TaxID=364098 RepID=A0ABW3BX95_SPHXN